MEAATKNSKINMRIASDALVQLRQAAAINQQDLTSFVLGAAMAHARQVLIERKTISLTEAEWQTLQAILDDETPFAPEVRARYAKAKSSKIELPA